MATQVAVAKAHECRRSIEIPKSHANILDDPPRLFLSRLPRSRSTQDFSPSRHHPRPPLLFTSLCNIHLLLSLSISLSLSLSLFLPCTHFLPLTIVSTQQSSQDHRRNLLLYPFDEANTSINSFIPDLLDKTPPSQNSSVQRERETIHTDYLSMSAAIAAAAAAALSSRRSSNGTTSAPAPAATRSDLLHSLIYPPVPPMLLLPTLSRYESQKRRDWSTFQQYLRDHRPPLVLSQCSGAHILEFLKHLDQFGKTKVHAEGCPLFGCPQPSPGCPCPLRQAWGSLDAIVGRLRAAFEENGGDPETNPFGTRAVRLYLKEVRDAQAKARGIAYEKKRRKKQCEEPRSDAIIFEH